MDATQLREIAKAMSDYGLAEVVLDEGGTHLAMRAKGAEPPAFAPDGAGAFAREGAPAGAGPLVPGASPSRPLAASVAAPDAAAPAGAGPGPAPSGTANPQEGLLVVPSPMVGVFYAAPAPGEAPFVSAGDEVQEGQVMCIVEAMKMMNEVGAPQAGTVREVLVRDSEPVEFDQPLFRIEPLG